MCVKKILEIYRHCEINVWVTKNKIIDLRIFLWWKLILMIILNRSSSNLIILMDWIITITTTVDLAGLALFEATEGLCRGTSPSWSRRALVALALRRRTGRPCRWSRTGTCWGYPAMEDFWGPTLGSIWWFRPCSLSPAVSIRFFSLWCKVHGRP